MVASSKLSLPPNARVALIAGTGTLPLEAISVFKKTNTPFFVVSLFAADNGDALKATIAEETDFFEHTFTHPAAIFELLRAQGATHVLMIGKVDKRALLSQLKFDWLALKFLGRMVGKSDATLLEHITAIIEQEGFEVLHQDIVLSSLIIPPGVLCGELTPYIETNIKLGLELADHISRYDIGQTVVFKDGMVLAVEAIEGTDLCIRRALELGTSNLIVCKSAQPNHNKKYDLPTIGPKTIESLKPGDVVAIAWRSSHTFIAERDRFITLANERCITLVSRN